MATRHIDRSRKVSQPQHRRASSPTQNEWAEELQHAKPIEKSSARYGRLKMRWLWSAAAIRAHVVFLSAITLLTYAVLAGQAEDYPQALIFWFGTSWQRVKGLDAGIFGHGRSFHGKEPMPPKSYAEGSADSTFSADRSLTQPQGRLPTILSAAPRFAILSREKPWKNR